MKTSCYVLFFYWFLLCIAQDVSGQKQTSEYTGDLLQQLKLDKNLSKEDYQRSEKILKDCAPQWEIIPYLFQEKVQEISKKIIKNKLKIYPHIIDFIETQFLFLKLEGPSTNFLTWLESLDRMLQERKTKSYLQLQTSTYLLLSESCLYKSNASTWMVSDLKFIFEENIFIFDHVNLISKAYKDSSCIYVTSGSFDPLEEKFKGEGGTVYWERSGILKEEMFAKVGEYEIKLRNARYTIDSVNFFHSKYFPNMTLGSFEDKLSAATKLEDVAYPQFISYESDLYMKDIFPDMDIEGNYVQKGSDVQFGQDGQSVRWYIRKEDKVQAKITADRLLYKIDRIIVPLGEWILYLGSDSIEHRTSEIRYDDKKKEILMMHSSTVQQEIPYVDNYHNVDIYCQAAYWYLDSGFVDFGVLHIPDRFGYSYFKSKNIYIDKEFQAVAGSFSVHPFYLLKKAADSYESRRLPIEYIAKFANADIAQMKVFLLQFAAEGFLIYDVKKEEVVLQEKLYHYLAISAKKEDFDVLMIESNVENDYTNARLYLDSADIEIKGVDKLYLSLKQRVYIEPYQKNILLRKNRDFIFDGYLRSGNFGFYTHQSNFFYDPFLFRIDIVDSLSFAFKRINEIGEVVEVGIASKLENFSGVLYIDSAINKGGAKNFSQFPIFESTTQSYVYYDDPKNQKGVYERDSFYFEVDSFRLERMNTLPIDSIMFKGYLRSFGLFPDIKDALVIQADYSLGFNHICESGGYPVYDGKARYYDTLKLSNLGLIGSGTLQYLNTRSSSSAFTFRPKEMFCMAESFIMEKKNLPSFPQIHGVGIEEKWDIESDIFYLKTKKNPLYLYADSLSFFGEYRFSPNYSNGKGRIRFPNMAEMKSGDFHLLKEEFRSDTVDFLIYTPDASASFIKTDGYQVEVDMLAQHGKFVSNAVISALYFPLNLYKSYAKNMDWEIQTNTLRITMSEEDAQKAETSYSQIMDMPLEERIKMPMEGVEYVSLHPKQDSLRFYSTYAQYTPEDSLLHIYQVPYITLADAFVAPDSGQVKIGPQAKILPLENAEIMIVSGDYIHHMERAEIELQSKKRFTGMADYIYESGDSLSQTIFFSNIKQDASGYTMAATKIERDSLGALYLNQGFDFIGNVELRPRQKLLHFRGSVGLMYGCEEYSAENRLRFESYIDPKNVNIPYSFQSKNIQGKSLGVGFYAQLTGAPFFAFLAPVRSSEKVILAYEGFVNFDADEKMYAIQDDKGDVKLRYYIDECIASATGDIQTGMKTEPLEVGLYGDFQVNLQEESFSIQSVFNVDFFFDEDLLKELADVFAKNTSLEAGNLGDSLYKEYLSHILPTRDAKKYMTELETYGLMTKIPEKLQKTISFSQVDFRWHSTRNAFISAGKASLSSIGKTPINKQLKTYIQLSKQRKGDAVDIYLEASRYDWVYIYYSDGVVQIFSSDLEFNDKIEQMKASKRKGKGMEFEVSSQRKKNDFVLKMQNLDNDEYIEPEPEEEVVLEEEVIEEEYVEEGNEEYVEEL